MNATISNSILSATINLKGAELISLKNHTSNREYIWEGNPEYWGKHSPVLFPIVGTLKNNFYTYNGKTYELTRHGFARDLNFTILNKENDKITFSLQFNETTFTFYPFKFELQIIYLLNNSELLVEYKVLNIDNHTIPFSIGGHPAFALNGEFETYSLQFDANENLTSYELENDLLSEKTKTIPLKNRVLPLSYSLFEKDALIFKTLNSKQIQILENDIPFLSFKFNDFPNFGIWTKINAPFICLEPWFGYSDPCNSNANIMEKEGIQLLEKNKTFECSFSIEIL
ncbi:aldose 1-epimerase family protein [Flavobacterium sp. RSB2_4_14]|uniref:aldose 1-epimerase family protein n=1 Tax=Flavobacterium sp. RSB2_4_14 TaxID=3447665 RepID=UPI003F312373